MAARDRSALDDLIQAQVHAGCVNFPFLRAKALRLLQPSENGTSTKTAVKSRWRAASPAVRKALNCSDTRTLASIAGSLTYLGADGLDGDAASDILRLVLDYIQSLPMLAASTTAASTVLLSAVSSGALEQLFGQVQTVMQHSSYLATSRPVQSSWTREISTAVAEMTVALPCLAPAGGSTASDVAGDVDVSLTEEMERQVIGGELLRYVAQYWPVADGNVACELLQSLQAEWVKPWLQKLQEGRSTATTRDTPHTGGSSVGSSGGNGGRGSVETGGSSPVWECRLVSGALDATSSAVEAERQLQAAARGEETAAERGGGDGKGKGSGSGNSSGSGTASLQAVAVPWLNDLPGVLEDALGLLQVG